MIKYIDFALTSPMVNMIRASQKKLADQPDEVKEAYFDGIRDRVKLIHDHELDIKPVLDFINKRAEVFARLTPYEQVLSVVLNDGKNKEGLYFPEIREYVQKINPELTEEEYQSAFDFWQQYQYHLKARDHIVTLSNLLSITGVSIRDGDYKDWGCIGFKGNPGNSDEVNHLISVVEKHTEYLGFTPWVSPMLGYLAKEDLMFSGSTEGEGVEFFLTTNIGTIYPYGKPKIKTETTNHLRSV